jgi:hypothetical protein
MGEMRETMLSDRTNGKYLLVIPIAPTTNNGSANQ